MGRAWAEPERGPSVAIPSVGRENGAANGISHLSLTAFRNFRALVLEIEPRPLVLTGPNGAGKSNILEAVSFLAPGSGMRSAGLREVDCRQQDNAANGKAWAIHARYRGRQGAFALGTGRDPREETADETARDRRLCRIEGAPARSQAAFAEILSILWLTPSMDRIFVERSSLRRRFLDRLVAGLHPEHPSRVSAYEQAMRERARVLRGDGPLVERTE
ncbi:MAG: AAA family ATPase, partial [Dongia sp.]